MNEFHKLPKLFIRDLLWLAMVCALAAGWWVEHRRATESDRWQRRAEILKAWIEANVGHSYVVFEDKSHTVEIGAGTETYLMSRPVPVPRVNP
jgi:hypothetical protein